MMRRSQTNTPRATASCLCQPDNRKGCCVCCGLFNMRDISKESLTRYLHGRGPREKDVRVEARPRLRPRDVRDHTSHICPFQGFLEGTTRPGCLLHPASGPGDRRERSLFGTLICAEYFCPAHHILNIEMKEMLIVHVDDWYAYCIAILDPASFIWMARTVRQELRLKPGKKRREQETSRALLHLLRSHSEFLNTLGIPLFHYSVSEYNLHKNLFSLASPSAEARERRRGLKEEIKKLGL